MKAINKISSISCIITIILLYIFNVLANGITFNGYVILITLFMLLNPVRNIYSTNKKINNNFFYNSMINIFSVYVSYITIKCLVPLMNYYKTDNVDYLNNSLNFFSDRFVYIIITVLLLLIISIFLKKYKVISNQDNSKCLVIIILISSILPFFSNIQTFSMIFTLSILIFSIYVLYNHNRINLTSDLQKYYLILIILGLLSFNPICFILSINMFIETDKFGINI